MIVIKMKTKFKSSSIISRSYRFQSGKYWFKQFQVDTLIPNHYPYFFPLEVSQEYLGNQDQAKAFLLSENCFWTPILELLSFSYVVLIL